MVNKRRRDELSDDDSEEITPGKQILPVANLPHDFNQEPQDGLQYLFLVRRDARRLPHVTRVRNPYEVPETTVAQTPTTSSTNVLPCEGWRAAFGTHFLNLRKNLAQATTHGNDYICSGRRRIPEKKDRDAWWKYLAGHPESAWHPKGRSVRRKPCTPTRTGVLIGPAKDTLPGLSALAVHEKQSRHESPITCSYDLPQIDSRQTNAADSLCIAKLPDMLADNDPLISPERRLLPPQVTPSHLREIDHRMSMHLLMYFTHWINVHLQNPNNSLTAISIGHAQWIFALLTKVEDQLSADEMNLLRNLARACIGLVERDRGRYARSEDAVLEGNSRPALIGQIRNMTDASCWMIFAAIAGHWGQRDLWMDAESTLGSA